MEIMSSNQLWVDSAVSLHFVKMLHLHMQNCKCNAERYVMLHMCATEELVCVCVHNSVYIGLCKIVPCIGSKWLENDVLYIRSHILRFVHHVVTWSLSSLSEDFIGHNFIFDLLLVWNLPLRGGEGEEPLCDKLLALLITVALSSELNMEHFLILSVAG